ncbi:FliH/SctL family protein [Sphingobium boeckii]|uniref:Flagellar assembly protein FliH n=1 Tax=Sphingobium boeckii TaxID=1082345 RepID=A0A7W9AGQ9_9SPHN|nr:FliH/SctL family protein [Sphingobium boeckii]MBB5685273.1 flagellar assembly protein FliH [Sphingobium boeckii]
MERVIQVRPFGFDRVFHFATADLAAKAEDAEAAAEIAGLQREIARLMDLHEVELSQARADGFEAGLHQARTERNAALLAAVDALHGALDDIEEHLIDAADAMKEDAADVALIAAEALAGHAVATAPALAISDALGRVLRQVARGTRLDIRVNPTLVDEVERCVEARKGQERRKLSITVLPDETIAAGDARINWDEGGLAIDAAARRQAVIDEIAPLLGQNSAD